VAVLLPSSVDDALRALADHPGATLLAGGTDLMVEVNGGHCELTDVIALGGVDDLQGWRHDHRSGTVTLGAGLTYTEMLHAPLATLLPALAQAARTVGSPQIRNAGTIGGNLGTASPAGDTLPVLSALDAAVTIAGAAGERDVLIHDYLLGVKRTALEAGELVISVTVPVVDGWQGFAKVGVRNAMVIAVTNACLVADRGSRSVRVAVGSVGPTVLRAREAEAWVAAQVDWEGWRLADPTAAAGFEERVAAEARPIDDHPSTADYRPYAVGVLARRLLQRAFPR